MQTKTIKKGKNTIELCYENNKWYPLTVNGKIDVDVAVQMAEESTKKQPPIYPETGDFADWEKRLKARYDEEQLIFAVQECNRWTLDELWDEDEEELSHCRFFAEHLENKRSLGLLDRHTDDMYDFEDDEEEDEDE